MKPYRLIGVSVEKFSLILKLYFFEFIFFALEEIFHCGNHYSLKHNLQRHIKTKHQKNRHNCDQCEKHIPRK